MGHDRPTPHNTSTGDKEAMTRYLTIALILAAALGGCRAAADPRYDHNPQLMPRHCATEEDRRLPSGVCVRRPVDPGYSWRRERRIPWVAGGSPYARDFFDEQERASGGHTE